MDREIKRPEWTVELFITAGLTIRLFAWGEGERHSERRTCPMRYDEKRRLWTSLPITH